MRTRRCGSRTGERSGAARRSCASNAEMRRQAATTSRSTPASPTPCIHPSTNRSSPWATRTGQYLATYMVEAAAVCYPQGLLQQRERRGATSAFSLFWLGIFLIGLSNCSSFGAPDVGMVGHFLTVQISICRRVWESAAVLGREFLGAQSGICRFLSAQLSFIAGLNYAHLAEKNDLWKVSHPHEQRKIKVVKTQIQKKPDRFSLECQHFFPFSPFQQPLLVLWFAAV